MSTTHIRGCHTLLLKGLCQHTMAITLVTNKPLSHTRLDAIRVDAEQPTVQVVERQGQHVDHLPWACPAVVTITGIITMLKTGSP